MAGQGEATGDTRPELLVLSSLPEQEAAHRIYRRLGFRRTPDRDWEPAEGVDLLAFRLDL